VLAALHAIGRIEGGGTPGHTWVGLGMPAKDQIGNGLHQCLSDKAQSYVGKLQRLASLKRCPAKKIARLPA